MHHAHLQKAQQLESANFNAILVSRRLLAAVGTEVKLLEYGKSTINATVSVTSTHQQFSDLLGRS